MTQSEQEIRVPAPSKAGWPDRYFAVIFTAQRTLSDEDMYSLTSQRMVELAQQQPGTPPAWRAALSRARCYACALL